VHIISASVVKLQSSSASNGEFAGGFAIRDAKILFWETDSKSGSSILPDAPTLFTIFDWRFLI
jgi:hypothetical protein